LLGLRSRIHFQQVGNRGNNRRTSYENEMKNTIQRQLSRQSSGDNEEVSY